jgi:hypothetical protein
VVVTPKQHDTHPLYCWLLKEVRTACKVRKIIIKEF